MSSPWSRENDSKDRMDSVIREHARDAATKLALLEKQVGYVAQMLRSVAEADAHLTAAECAEVAGLLERR